MEERLVAMEGHLADDASATEEQAKSLQKLQELYISIDERLMQLNDMLGNYIEATRARERQAKLTEDAAKGLVSEIRKRCAEQANGQR